MPVSSHRIARIAWFSIMITMGEARAIEWSGLADVRFLASNADRSGANGSLGKLRYDASSEGLRLGQAILRGSGDLLDTVSASVVLSASDDRRGVIDVNEAWLGWNPVPGSAWKTKVKLGAFFPPSSVEIDYDSVGWTPVRTISSAAINSWIGEELRTKGVEWNLTHRGRPAGSPHDFGVTAALFGGNDPAGTVIAWRGWSIDDRISGLSEPRRLADLPVYRADGAIPRQSRTVHLFRELDHRLGYYLGANYAYADTLEVAVLHYDNRGDPLVVSDGQYSWHTKFNHANMRLHPGGDWELLLQALDGSTLMGPNAVNVGFRSWYMLASHPVWHGRLALRFDQFSTSERDILPSDPNRETGRGLAIAYSFVVSQSVSVVIEALTVQSWRPARTLLRAAPGQAESSITSAVRWIF